MRALPCPPLSNAPVGAARLVGVIERWQDGAVRFLFWARAPALSTAIRICLLATIVDAGLKSQSAEPVERSADSSLGQGATNDAIRQVGPGLYEIGKVRLDQKKRTIAFPATVNLREGPIEYVLVTDSGKIHESLLRTDVNPSSIQMALLLLSATAPVTNAAPGTRSQAIAGSRIGIEISWVDKKKIRRQRAGDFVWDRAAKSRLGRGKWYFCGSSFRPDGFAAQLDGSIITVIDDGDAIIGSQASRREDDDNWLAYGSALPPGDSEVEVMLTVRR